MSSVPVITFPPELPISAHVDEISRLLADHQVIVVAGETGSGKSTQLPKIAMALGRTSIAHTQPRRIAARTIAERVAEELGESVGETVGYRVRFTDAVGADTRLTVMTDGILLNAVHKDRYLSQWDTIIIDEAHERSLNIDFLLGYLARMLPKRPDLRVIVTSATIDPESFSRHFGGAPIVLVSGRTYPVEIRYRSLVPEKAEMPDEPGERQKSGHPQAEVRADARPEGDASIDSGLLTEGICGAVAELTREPTGDVLVFVSGEADIRDAQAALEGRVAAGKLPANLDVLPLFGRLSNADQHRVFEVGGRAGRQRVVIATNIAETSITVPGIRYVVDTGLARISRYSTRSKVQRLPIEAISQASAKQRSGRCGRTSDGIAIRLYAEDDYLTRPEYTEPEIQRTNLASVILQMASLRLGPIEEFPFLTPPDSRGIRDGMDLLRELGALDASGAITRIGRQLARLPIEPRYGRMILASAEEGTTREVIAIVAGLTVQDVRERPLERREAAAQKHARFADETSDFLTLVNLWNYLEEKRRELSGGAFRRMCRDEFIHYMRVREWNDLYSQLCGLARSLKLKVGEPAVNPDGIHRAILTGLLSHMGVRDERSKNPKRPEYRGARGTRFSIFPGSALARKPPETVMAAELVETSKLYARSVAAIDLEWAEKIAGDRAVRSISEPHWDSRQGAAIAYERVTVYGLTVVERRPVQFARFDHEHARALFIHHALVDGEWDSPQAFDRDNRRLRRRLAQVEEASRRRDILRDDEAVYEFYAARVPEDVVSTRSFEGWWRKARRDTPDLLTMTEGDLLEHSEDAQIDQAEFPREWHSGGQKLRLDYRFEPGARDDGVTVTVPLALLPHFDEEAFEGSIPGFRLELVTALIKSLPKSIRKHVVPAADNAAVFVAQLDADRTENPAPLSERLATLIAAKTHIPVAASDFDWTRVSPHLIPTFRLIDARGKTLATDKDLAALQRTFASQAAEAVATMAAEAAKRGRQAEVAAASTRSSAMSSAADGKGEGKTRGNGRRSVAHEKPVPIAARSGVQAWDVDVMPRHFEVRRGGIAVTAYPAYAVGAAGIEVRICASQLEQERAHRAAVRALVAASTPTPASYIREHLSQPERLALASAPYLSLGAVIDDVLSAVAGDAVASVSIDGLLWTRVDFDRAAQHFAGSIMDAAYDMVATVARIMRGVRDVDVAISEASSANLIAPLSEVRDQVGALVYPGFVAVTDTAHLRRIPVYLAAAAQRVARLREDPGRDRHASVDVTAAVDAYRKAGGSIPATADQAAGLTKVRWMLEELRVSAFAQKLGTDGPVSLTRVNKALATL